MDRIALPVAWLVATLAIAAPPALAQPRRGAAAASFASARGFGPLRWTMDPQAARQALERAGIAVREEERVGFFDHPAPPRVGDAGGAAPAMRWAEVSFITLTFAWEGVEASVEFEAIRMRQVRVVRRGLRTRSEAERTLTALRARYGHEASADPVREYATGTVYRWVNPDTRLALHVTTVPGQSAGWFATEEWSPSTPPPSWR